MQPGGAYSDNDARKSNDSGADKPLPTSPADPAGRPSFAIEDEDDDEEGDQRSRPEPPAPAPASGNNKATRVLGQQEPFVYSGQEPPEPVIALRPIDEQTAAEAAAEFGAPVVQRYEGLRDCLHKMVDEEGIEALGRGAWVTLLGVFAGSFS
jgi:hypothetical protein